jgi:hypothetical protein
VNIEHDKWIEWDNCKRYFPSSNEPHCYIYRDRALFVVKEEGASYILSKCVITRKQRRL